MQSARGRHRPHLGRRRPGLRREGHRARRALAPDTRGRPGLPRRRARRARHTRTRWTELTITNCRKTPSSRCRRRAAPCRWRSRPSRRWTSTQLTTAGPRGRHRQRGRLKKHELIFRILQAQAERNGLLFAEGVLEILPDGYGFLRAPESSYLPGPRRHLRLALADPALRPAHRRHRQRAGAPAQARASATSRSSGSRRSTSSRPSAAKDKVLFDNLTPLYPRERLRLETTQDNMTARVLDLMTPIGKGQRGLIVSPPRTGKTMILQNIANSIAVNHPEVILIVLLDRRAARGGHRHAAHGAGRGGLVDLRRARRRATCRWPRW